MPDAPAAQNKEWNINLSHKNTRAGFQSYASLLQGKIAKYNQKATMNIKKKPHESHVSVYVKEEVNKTEL